MKLEITATEVLEWTGRLLAVYVVIDSFEKLCLAKQYIGGGLFDWHMLKENNFYKRQHAFIRKLSDAVFFTPVWTGLLFLRLLCGVYLLFFSSFLTDSIYCFFTLFLVSSLINYRNIAYGAEAENRFSLIITGALLLQKIVPTHTVTMVAFWFIALQVCLSYLTAGVAKLFNVNWRNGGGFYRIITAYNKVPLPAINLFFEQRRPLSKFINWSVIVFECFFSLTLVVGRPYFWWFLGFGIVFHASIAIWLRLGKFFWVWIATYPALIFITQ